MDTNTGASVGTGAISGAASGAMVAGPWGAVVGGVVGAAGGLMSGMGAEKEAKRRDRAIKRYKQRSSELYDLMAKDAWAAGRERQTGTGKTLEGLRGAMGSPGTVAPDVASFLPAEAADTTGFRGAEYQAVDGLSPRLGVEQANLAANQSNLNRGDMERALSELGFSSGVESMAQAPAHTRAQWKWQQDLAEAQAQLDAILGSTSNAADNLKLAGSLVGSGVQAAGVIGAHMGGPSNNIPGGGGPGTTPVVPSGMGSNALYSSPGYSVPMDLR